MEKYNLFLDDIREPYEVGNYFNPVEFRKLFRLEKWQIVKNYEEFIRSVETLGLPELISFDHDLSDFQAMKSGYPELMEGAEFTENEKTGYDCAKWLVDYCSNKGLKLPRYLCHSMNPIGKENILKYLDNYRIWQSF